MDSTIQLLLNWGQDNTLLGSCHIFITKCTHIYNILFYGWYFFIICIYVLLRGKINFLSSRWNDSNYYRIRGAKNYFVSLSTLRDLSEISRGEGRWKQREGHIGHWSCRGSPTEKKEVLYLVKKLGRNRRVEWSAVRKRVGLSMLSSKMYVYSITKNQLEISFAFS